MGQRPMALQTSMLSQPADDYRADRQPPPPLVPSESVGTITFMPSMAAATAHQPASPHLRSRSNSPAPVTKVRLSPWPA